MNGLVPAGAAHSDPRTLPVNVAMAPLTVPDDLLPRLNLTIWKIGNAEVMFDNDRNISVSRWGNSRLTLDHEAIGRNREARGPLPPRWLVSEPELPFQFNISPKLAFVAMLVAVANLIPLLADPFERNA